MRLIELINEDPGLFMAVKFDSETLDNLEKFVEENNIPNPVKREDFHTTIVFSDKYADVKPEQYKVRIKPDSYEFDLFGDENNCLVLKYKSKKLTNRNKKALKAGAQSKYDEYKPHVTLSYDAPDFDIQNLPKPDFSLILVDEYQTAANDDWAKNK